MSHLKIEDRSIEYLGPEYCASFRVGTPPSLMHKIPTLLWEGEFVMLSYLKGS